MCRTLCDPMDCSTPGFPVHHHLLEFAQTHVHWVRDAIQPSHRLSCPLFFLPSIFPSIRVFSSESALPIRWPKDWSFSFSISPSKEYSGLIFFRMDWLDLLAVQGTLKSLLQHHSSKHPFFDTQSSLWFSHSPISPGKTIALPIRTVFSEVATTKGRDFYKDTGCWVLFHNPTYQPRFLYHINE